MVKQKHFQTTGFSDLQSKPTSHLNYIKKILALSIDKSPIFYGQIADKNLIYTTLRSSHSRV